MDFTSLAHNVLLKLNAELSHNIALWAIKSGLVRNHLSDYHDFLKVNVLGKCFKHPVGLAAGFDKNAMCVKQLLKCGFSFVEVGTVTVKPQYGNPKPRIFRVREDSAVVNKLGFNNKGIKSLKKNIAKSYDGIFGVNVGKNRDATDAVSDYVRLIQEVGNLASYITINISSPNTKGLRGLQEKEKLNDLLSSIKPTVPVMLKISPDVSDSEKEGIAELALKYNLDGLILTNTTINHRHSKVGGGLSGKPLFDLSTHVLRDMYQLTQNKLTLIGCGGIFSGKDAYLKVKSGASLLQVYTGLIYRGFKIIDEINLELIDLLQKDGFKNLEEAIGIDVRK